MADVTIPPTLGQTRESLHRVAEHLLAAAQYAAAGTIRLRPGPGGFRTMPFGVPATVLGVDRVDLVVARGGAERRTRLTTIRALGAFAGVTPGFANAPYAPATPFEPDAPLTVDPASAAMLADWYQLGATALERFAVKIGDESPSRAVLWPEHFDLGITAAAVNYGTSPGDATVPQPYVYVGPHELPPTEGAFWNGAFGAFRTIHDIRSADDAVAFFVEGHARAQETKENRA